MSKRVLVEGVVSGLVFFLSFLSPPPPFFFFFRFYLSPSRLYSVIIPRPRQLAFTKTIGASAC